MTNLTGANLTTATCQDAANLTTATCQAGAPETLAAIIALAIALAFVIGTVASIVFAIRGFGRALARRRKKK